MLRGTWQRLRRNHVLHISKDGKTSLKVLYRVRESTTHTKRKTRTSRATSLGSAFTVADALLLPWASELDGASGAITISRGSGFTEIGYSDDRVKTTFREFGTETHNRIPRLIVLFVVHDHNISGVIEWA